MTFRLRRRRACRAVIWRRGGATVLTARRTEASLFEELLGRLPATPVELMQAARQRQNPRRHYPPEQLSWAEPMVQTVIMLPAFGKLVLSRKRSLPLVVVYWLLQ